MKYTLTICFLLAAGIAVAQNKYGLKTIRLEQYRQSLKDHPEKELVRIDKEIPGILLDIRYATTDNFLGEVIYTMPRAYARKPVVAALKKIQAVLRKQGLALKIFDGYRPYAATVLFYERAHDTTFVASPYRGSKHNRGCALDLTVIRLSTGAELKMPTPWDAFMKEASPTYPIQDAEARANRDMLIAVMEQNGFKVYENEWWHFDFVGWENYEVMDINFEELGD